jgi:diguanylate cyclase (GGDEF)-like protein
MELKIYWRMVKKWWWLIVMTVLIVVGATYALTSRQRPVYETSATFVIRPRLSPTSGTEAERSDDFVRALDMVSRRVEINTTFAEVATSRLIKQEAITELGLTSAQRQGLDVSARVIGGTNVLEISVGGHDPTIIRDFTNEVGERTVAYVSGLYDVFELEPLDAAVSPSRPVRPNLIVNLLMGLVLGLALGGSLVFMLHYLESAAVGPESFNIIDRETGAYTRSYLLHRLWAEISRARRVERPLSLGLLRIAIDQEAGERHPESYAEAMQLTKAAVARALREEDVLARFDQDTYAMLLVDLSSAEATALLKNVLARVRSLAQPAEGHRRVGTLRASTGLATYTEFQMEPEQLLESAMRALETGADVAVASTPVVAAPAEPTAPSGNGVVKEAAQPQARTSAGAARRGSRRALKGEAK